MTLLNILFLLGFIVVMFMMMKKGGGCCGGHDQQEPQKSGGCCGADDQQESHDHQAELENAGGGSNIDPVCGMTVDGEGGLSSQQHGKNYTFCSEHCQKSFDSDPDKYV